MLADDLISTEPQYFFGTLAPMYDVALGVNDKYTSIREQFGKQLEAPEGVNGLKPVS